jgi:hypothetical protein
MAKDIVKDLAKTAVTKALDAIERSAWEEFFRKDLIARASYPAYRSARALFHQVENGIVALQARRLALVEAGIDETGFRIDTSTALPVDAPLEIRLQVTTERRAEDIELSLRVGGVRLVPAARRELRRGQIELVYRTTTRALDAGADGLLALEVR